MRTLCLQFQSERAPKVSVGHLSVLMLRIALAEKAYENLRFRKTVRKNTSTTYSSVRWLVAYGALFASVRCTTGYSVPLSVVPASPQQRARRGGTITFCCTILIRSKRSID